jgi:tripartite-type tricarboxylate transporter receptor subunit TctC
VPPVARLMSTHASQPAPAEALASRLSSTTVRGGSIIGTDAAAKSAADGYTLLLMSNTHSVNESLIPNKPYQLLRDFVPIAPINYPTWCWPSTHRCRPTRLPI